MNRTIKFRGKSLNTSMWVYGDLQQKGKKAFIEYEVNPETVWQCTGLRDKNGKEIYEGDIVKTKEYGIEIPNGKVSFNSVGYDNFIINYIDGGFRLSNNHRCFLLCRGNHLEVNGNIYDNPELINS